VSDHYDFRKVEARWQAKWQEQALYDVEADDSRPKFYCLEMFPYPSGALHMGHVRNYSIGDVLSRFKRMNGFNVLHPMGFDAFGLPAENAAIQNKTHPKQWTERNIRHMTEQLKTLGTSYDWRRQAVTCAPEYYRWTQWLFLLLYKNGLAYKKKAFVNWCPSCSTVLANEQVEDGMCWRCESQVTKKSLDQWFFRITSYADRLLEDLSLLSGWPERVRTMQQNWIGRSEGVELEFTLAETGDRIPVYTTRHDTIFGVTYMVLAPEHPLVEKIAQFSPHQDEINRFVERMKSLTEIARTSTETEKEGIFIGAHALNPLSGERVPVLIANYVLMEYGTGAVMGVPGHDERDFEFARKYGLPIREVIQDPENTTGVLESAYTGEGIMVNSGAYNGLSSVDGREKIAAYVEQKGIGKRTTNYRIRDWLVSRQRYWGAPIPIIYCDKCGEIPVPEEQLPVELPTDVDFGTTGRSPLETSDKFVNTVCPKCGGPAKRETDTMDTFVCSSWYFLYYCSTQRDSLPFAKEDVKYWFPVDQYIGGIEHAVMHLLYARFFTKVLYDHALCNSPEPFTNLLTQGMVIKDGAKMSKSKGNVVAPDEIITKYGADTARLFVLFASPPERDLDWSDQGVEGAFRFLHRVWRLAKACSSESHKVRTHAVQDATRENARELRRLVHRALDKVSTDIGQRFNFNTALAAIMETVNALYEYREKHGMQDAAFGEAIRILTLMLAPFAPHLAEEMWVLLGGTGSVHTQSWPEIDKEATKSDSVTVVVQINGRVRDKMDVQAGLPEAELEKHALAQPRVQELIGDKTIVKIVSVKNKVVSIVVR